VPRPTRKREERGKSLIGAEKKKGRRDFAGGGWTFVGLSPKQAWREGPRNQLEKK